MKVRNTQTPPLDETQLLLAKGITLHPTLQTIADTQLLDLERSDKICRLPSTILNMYHHALVSKLKAFKERCQIQNPEVTSSRAN